MSDRPRIYFEKWDEIPKHHDLRVPHPRTELGRESLQCGFYLGNDGGPAYDIQVEDFEISDLIRAKSRNIPRIGDGETRFALVWVHGWPNPEKWDLPAAMAAAYQQKFGDTSHNRELSLRVRVRYKDADGQPYST